VVVHDEVDLGAIVAAESLGFPHVGVIVLAAGGLLRPELVAEPLDVLRTAHQLPPDPGLAALHRHLTLVPVPPSFRAPTDTLPITARHVRPAALEPMGTSLGAPGAAALLDWICRRHGQPTVYLTLGTIFGQESGDLLSWVLAGLVELDVNVIVTVGREIDPTELGHQPTNVRVEQYLPQEVLLPHCDVVVCHGGSGSVLGALAFGVPLVLLPMGADQPLNADRCEALGVARVLDPTTTTRSLITATVREVLTTPSYRRAAQRLRNEAATLPPAQQAASWVEDLVESEQPEAPPPAPVNPPRGLVADQPNPLTQLSRPDKYRPRCRPRTRRPGSTTNDLDFNRSTHHSATVVSCAEAPCPVDPPSAGLSGGDGGQWRLAPGLGPGCRAIPGSRNARVRGSSSWISAR